MIRVLLVEDDPVIRDTTRYFLQSQQNFEVVCAETGGDALSHARERFDVILMDILLPDTNGVDLCQRLRSWHHCPILFTSCLDDTDTVVRALELLPPQTVIGRLTGDGMAADLLAPAWSRKKIAVLNDIDKALYAADSWQGKLYKQ